MTTGTWQMRPESKGYVRARSREPHVAPLIQPNYLAAETDQRAIVAGFHMCRRFLGTAALRPYFEAETLPGGDVETDDEILDYARSNGSTVYHAVSSCRMGPDPMAVVDDQLRVKGLECLRVIDASVMPTMPSANTNAATMMIAEKGADLLKAAAKA
jgi:choline dehydrogenase